MESSAEQILIEQFLQSLQEILVQRDTVQAGIASVKQIVSAFVEIESWNENPVFSTDINGELNF